jgi:chorismate mutase / prephenate dehydratase
MGQASGGFKCPLVLRPALALGYGWTPRMSQSPSSLADLRRRLDSIDERLLDLLMERARAMEDVRAAKNAAEGPNAKLARPGRELAILRRLVARIQGPLPPGLVVRLWRDIMTSFTRLQGAFSVAVWDANANANSNAGSLMALARRHYGQATPLLPASSPAQAIARLDDARAQLALLPVPEDAPELNWWRNLSPTGLQVLARLPVDGQETQPGAFVVGRQPFEESGNDRGLLIVAADLQASRAKLVQLSASLPSWLSRASRYSWLSTRPMSGPATHVWPPWPPTACARSLRAAMACRWAWRPNRPPKESAHERPCSAPRHS